MKVWTAEAVVRRLEQAALALQRKHEPGCWPKGYGSSWPDVVRNYWESARFTRAEPPRIQPREGPATPEGSSPGAGAVEPPPTEPSSRGCAVEKPHASPAALALLGGLGLLGVANRRRRTVR